MRWLPWRRKQARAEAADRSGGVAIAERPSRGMGAPAMIVEPRGATLALARDALALSGAQVRVEEPDLLAATLPDGARARYTGSLARARGEADVTLLVQGGAALGALLDEVALRGSHVAFALPAEGDPLALASGALSEPPADCGRCATGPNAETEALCTACPLRAGRLALRGAGRVMGARELRRREALAVELTYRVTYRDRNGRRDELHRLAYDAATAEPVAPVALDALAACAPIAMPSSLDAAPIGERARTDLARTMESGAALLALRADAEYQRRLHDLGLTHVRLVRETPEARADLEAGHDAERARLADLFAVGVEAELAGVAYISTTLAEVAVRHAGGELALAVDLGRRLVLPPRCAACGRGVHAGMLCVQGHIACAVCANGASTCPVCAGAPANNAEAHRRQRAPRRATPAGATTLTPEQLADLSEPLWQSFVGWYLADAGYAVEAPDVVRGLPCWRLRSAADNGQAGAVAGRAVALRLAPGRRLGAADVRTALDVGRESTSEPLMVMITPAVADSSAIEAAAAADVRLVACDALAAFLERMAAAHTTALAEAKHQAEARAQAAIETQHAILGALTAAEKEIASCINSRRVTGRGPLAATTNSATAALREAERALVAWETLVADWLASFDERPAPDGSLRIRATTDEFHALAERAEHLRSAFGRPIAALAATPGAGESGYSAWRKAVLERLTAACEALCWQASVVNAERWRDAHAAHDANAVAHAEAAAQAVKHSASRAAKAHDQLAARIGL